MKGGQKYLRGVKLSSILAALVLGSALSPARAQDPFENDYLRSTLSMENGLPCNFIDDICQDDAGFLWLATSGGGLCRFDGYDLLTFGATSAVPLKSNFIRNVCEDRFHRLWIASEGGLDLLDLGTLDRLDLPHPTLEAYAGQLCSFLTLDTAGNLWFKTGKTLACVSFDEKGGVRDVLAFTHDGLSPANFVFEDVDGDGTGWAGRDRPAPGRPSRSCRASSTGNRPTSPTSCRPARVSGSRRRTACISSTAGPANGSGTPTIPETHDP